MSQSYTSLKQAPQTGINRGCLTFEERFDLRQIRIVGTSGHNRSNMSHRFTSVYYLEGDEEAAASLFVDENRDSLERIDFSKSNGVQGDLSRDIYDWVLHYLNIRQLEKESRVIREYRPAEAVTWVIARDKFETVPNRRYSIGGTGSAKLVDISLEQLYDELPPTCTLSALPTKARGDVAWIFVYFDESADFDCTVTPRDDGVYLTKAE